MCELLGELSSTAPARYSVYLLYWYKSTNTEVLPRSRRQSLAAPQGRARQGEQQVYSFYLLYWYKSANTDATGERLSAGTQFTCFASTKVQILTQQARSSSGGSAHKGPAAAAHAHARPDPLALGCFLYPFSRFRFRFLLLVLDSFAGNSLPSGTNSLVNMQACLPHWVSQPLSTDYSALPPRPHRLLMGLQWGRQGQGPRSTRQHQSRCVV